MFIVRRLVVKRRKTPDQRGALDALRAVASALDLPPGEAPTAKQFTELASKVAPGWSVHRVTVAWGRWRLATLAFREGRGPERRLHFGRMPHSTEPANKALHALRLWLANSPEHLTIASYERFAKKHNRSLGPKDEPMPMSTAIYNALKINFSEAVLVARGDVSLEDAAPYELKNTSKIHDDKEGPYGLIPPDVAAEICGVSRNHLNGVLRRRQDFPVASLVLGDIHLRRRSDVEAFARGEDVPPRRFNELADQYATVSQIAEQLGLDVTTVRDVKWMPEPEVVASGRRGYRRSEILDALQRRGLGKS